MRLRELISESARSTRFDAMKKMVSDPSTPEHERSAAKAFLDKHMKENPPPKAIQHQDLSKHIEVAKKHGYESQSSSTHMWGGPSNHSFLKKGKTNNWVTLTNRNGPPQWSSEKNGNKVTGSSHQDLDAHLEKEKQIG